MENSSFTPQEWTHPLTGYRLAGWVEGFGLLAGIGAMPLLVRLSQPAQAWRWLNGWYWAASLVAGLLVMGTGLSYLVRSRRQAGAEKPGPAGADPASDLCQATLLIMLGVFVMLPALAVPLLRLGEVAETVPAAAYLGSPALLLWAYFEGVAFNANWRARAPWKTWIPGLVRSGAQALAALLLWIFIGMGNSFGWMIWLFWIAAGLVLLGALAGTFMPAAGRQPGVPVAESIPSSTDPGEDSHASTKIEPLSFPVQTAEVAETLTQPGSTAKEPELVLTRRAVFQVFRGEDRQYYFRLRAANGETILSSEGYRSKSGCRNGIRSVRQNAALAGRFERGEASDGQYYFVLNAANHQVIGTSESYTTVGGREAGILAVMRVAPQAGAEESE